MSPTLIKLELSAEGCLVLGGGGNREVCLCFHCDAVASKNVPRGGNNGQEAKREPAKGRAENTESLKANSSLGDD